MRRDEAEAICERLNREHPERGSHRWFPRAPTPGNPGELPGGVSPWIGPG